MRELATVLEVSPSTVAAAYRVLKQRGLVSANRRRGTVVASEPPVRVRPSRPLPAHVRDLASGNPDPALLPALEPALRRVNAEHTLYGAPAKLAELVALARQSFAADGIDGEIAVVGGALDAIERVLQTHLWPGDRVVVEDPTWPRVTDLVRALGLEPHPAPIDERGFVADDLERALAGGAKAVIATPRGQNPTGAALDADRARALCEALERHPDVLVIEDDYVAAVAGAPYFGLHGAARRWSVVRSLSKVFGPDLRIALVAGDPLTIARLERRHLVGPGWVSHLLQQTAAQLWRTAATWTLLRGAQRTYAARRDALIGALAERGIAASGSSGLGVWVPVEEEVPIVQLLLEAGWAVSPGERYRFNAPPGIRITTAALEPQEAKELAKAFDAARRGSTAATYAG